jgi:hypothetical protein
MTLARRAKLSAAASGRKQSAETIAKRIASIAVHKAEFGDEKRLAAHRIAMRNPIYRAAQSERSRIALRNPDTRRLIAVKMAAYRARPEVRAKYSALMSTRNALGNNQTVKTHCPRGHPYDAENTYTKPNGWRRCRKCARAEGRARRNRMAGQLDLPLYGTQSLQRTAA